MLTNRAFPVWCIVLVLGISISPVVAETTQSMHAPAALPGVEPEMLTPEYWIALQEKPEAVIMTPAGIDAFNAANRNKPVNSVRYEGPLANPILPLELPDTVSGETLRVRLTSNIDKLFHPDNLYGSREYYDGRNTSYNDEMKRELVEDINLEAVPALITRRFGVIVNHTSVRQYPTSVPGYGDTQVELDRFQITDLCIGNPVAILHRSLDGDFLFVESPIALGWIETGDIAVAERETIRGIATDDAFLMATGHKVPVYGDPSYQHYVRYMYFSATMPILSHNSTGYTVNMPQRASDGSLELARGYIKPDADVNIGYLPYTRKNVLTQFFKLLGKPYGWHGQNDKSDCAGTIRVVFRCSGIVTGRSIGAASDNRVTIDKDLSTEEKRAKIGRIEPVITAASDPGHVVLFLGKAHNGKLYFMHQCGWGYDENDTHFYVNRVTINSEDHSLYPLNQPRVFTTMK
jgi:hypothetical protein